MVKKRWRDESLRLRHYDYSGNGAYFVTINTKNRIRYFGDVKEGIMIHSEIGLLAVNFWKTIPSHFPFAEIDEFVVMPDHVHGIIVINKKKEIKNPGDASSSSLSPVGMPNLGIPSLEREEEEATKSSAPKKGGYRKEWKPGTLGVIINQYKRVCTIHARKINPSFAWQSNYHDRVIWNNRSFFLIAEYIKNNPGNWQSPPGGGMPHRGRMPYQGIPPR